MKISSWNFENDYVSLVKLLQDSNWIEYENGKGNLLPIRIIDRPNIFLLNVNDNCFLKFHHRYNIESMELIVKELMEYI